MATLQPTVKEAQAEHRRQGFKKYSGPKLEGDRFVIPFGSNSFPNALMEIPDPPDCLYLIGSVDALCEGLAVIGARRATPYGRTCAHHFAGLAAEAGVTIISGGALGCDSEAHRAALEHNGSTVVFLGGGCDCVYPAANFQLFQDVIRAGGAVVSEHPWDFPPLPYAFRTRNRLIAGLARATCIVEAGLPSGTFSTADEALAAGKEVLVVPGSITSKSSAGSNRLLYQGATPIVDDDTFADALFSLFSCLKVEQMGNNDGQRNGLKKSVYSNDAMLEALQAQPMRIDEIMHWIKVPKGQEPRSWYAVHLAELERDGLIARYPDGRYGPSSL